MDARNIRLTNFVYQGEDDCIAIKPRSYDIDIHNVTCRGGNGIAIGSLGQYKEDSSVENVRIDKVKIIRYNDDMHGSAYIKTWTGVPTPQDSYESAGLPRGGGWGNGDNGSYPGTSLMTVSDITFANFTCYVTNEGEVTSTVTCSEKHPCYDIYYDNVVLYPGKNASEPGIGSCKWTTDNGVHGLEGC
ncbi:galacturan 1,4-alpha-galacturonidase C [Aspergillus flavus AF70]|nr:galacturan 1,4-alpha-galacturonidase C [Aspergillus flavus AF70]